MQPIFAQYMHSICAKICVCIQGIQFLKKQHFCLFLSSCNFFVRLLDYNLVLQLTTEQQHSVLFIIINCLCDDQLKKVKVFYTFFSVIDTCSKMYYCLGMYFFYFAYIRSWTECRKEYLILCTFRHFTLLLYVYGINRYIQRLKLKLIHYIR